jgi:hypothetical protein
MEAAGGCVAGTLFVTFFLLLAAYKESPRLAMPCPGDFSRVRKNL